MQFAFLILLHSIWNLHIQLHKNDVYLYQKLTKAHNNVTSLSVQTVSERYHVFSFYIIN